MNANRVWALGAAILMIAIVALGWFVGVGPVLTQAATADADRANVEAQNQAQRNLLEQMRTQFETIGEMREELAALREVIPGTLEMEDFLDRAAGIADDLDLRIVTVTATEPRPYGAEAEEAPTEAAPADPESDSADQPATGDGSEAPVAQNDVYMVHVTIAVEGEAAAVTRFADRLQKSSRYFLVSGFSFNGPVTATTPGGALEGYLFVAPEG